MAHLKKLYNLNANSLIESVISMSIISICLFIAIVIYATVFTSKTSENYYNKFNETDEAFFIAQIDNDSLIEKFADEGWQIDQENTKGLKKITINPVDNSVKFPERTFYILGE